jgi:hypothetical protein
MNLNLAEHHIAQRGQHLPPVNESLMLDYIMGSNGMFARGRRPGLEVCMPIAAPPLPVRGLACVQPYAQWGFPKLPARFLERMLSISRLRARDRDGVKEVLFHLSFNQSFVLRENEKVLDFHLGWHLEYPEQLAQHNHVVPTGSGRASEARAIVEVHSHPFDDARFSPQDDKDEGGMAFRIYGVIGNIFSSSPEIRARVGLFGHFFEYPASEFFELPEGLIDCVAENKQ